VLGERGHEVITASRKGSELSVDITDPGSIQAMYAEVGRVDGVAVAAGSVPWKPFGELSSEDVWLGLAGKVASQVELVRLGSQYASEEASFTLITGVLARDWLVTALAYVRSIEGRQTGQVYVVE